MQKLCQDLADFEPDKNLRACAKSSTAAIKAGTTNKISKVATPSPNTMVIAIGIRN